VRIGIVGLPNAGKSSLFTALTGVSVQAANYPFTTIEPNVAVVPVRDERLEAVAEVVRASEVVPDAITFHDIAGLVAGAHRGEGLGNQFLAHIRETDAIVHVIRVHESPEVVHPDGRIDPLADLETVETELIYADLEQAERRLERVAKAARGGDRGASEEERLLRDLVEALQSGRPAAALYPADELPEALRALALLTAKPVLYVANVEEGSAEVPPELQRHAATSGAGVVALSARLEAELSELPPEEATAIRAEFGMEGSGVEAVIQGAFSLLSLIAFFTADGGRPAHSWHVREGLSVWHAAGLIHTDMQRGFVRAEVVPWQDLVAARGYAGARERGSLRLEGREYQVRDGDVILVKFTP
jgi:GTP-binding protein YchF